MDTNTEKRARRVIFSGLCLGLLVIQAGNVGAQTVDGEWRSYHGDRASTKYTPLDQINRDNVSQVRVLWRRPGVAPKITAAEPDLNPFYNFRSSPLMVDGVLYASNAVGLIEAFDPGTGETIWVQEPLHAGFKGLVGLPTRGVAYWSNGSERRIFAARGDYLESMNAETGRLDRAFGDGGKLNLEREGAHGMIPAAGSAGPVVVGDLVIIAGTDGHDFGTLKEGPPEDVRAFDVRTGQLRWTFHVVPREGEFGTETWQNDSWKTGGASGSWANLTVDDELGYVYVATGSPGNAWYGGHRPGENLFANSLLCLDAKTGERVWHFQMIHHDLWDYDFASAPVLGDITVDGKPIKAVMVVGKSALLYAFDRATGAPVWPIEERPVPASTVPGEKAWPTQPIPTKPAPIDRQGITIGDLIDFTPELRAEALELIKPYLLGAPFEPPSVAAPGHTQGTINYPGMGGGVNWAGGAFDPETGFIYVPSFTIGTTNDLVRPPALELATTPYMHGPESDSLEAQNVMAWCCSQFILDGPEGLPLVKPPYGRLTAIDMNTGEHAWMVAAGDGPRDHPRLRHLNLPPLGYAAKTAPLVTKTLVFMGEGSQSTSLLLSGGNKFRAYDKATGEIVWEFELPAGATGAPISYSWKGKQYIVMAIADPDNPPGWVALGLP